MRRAVFLDRDGVLMEDRDFAWLPEHVTLYPGVPRALARLREAGFALVVVTNQPVIARGMATPSQVEALHAWLNERLAREGGAIDRFEYCPHHPNATLAAFRAVCGCRKPRPGMLLRAAEALSLDLARSELVGDRPSDIGAGRAAGCTTTLVTTGKHLDPRIVSPDDYDGTPHRTCASLVEAVEVILGGEVR